ncbi:MAG: hypothetical protein ABR571_02735 [Jatrophihabitans sp.]|uniref:hypothetical protein n=1 Tax=Jatrophihabitans sp. TaxID=1932789 RepID=UPI0039123B09
MSVSAKLRRAPLRAVTGAYILNSGVGKFGADDDTAKTLHGFASGTYPFLSKLQPKVYAKALGVGEMAVGGVLLLPVFSPVVAGAVLAGFSGALLNVYWNTPGMHAEGNPRPTVAGSPLAKDAWMFGIGTSLIVDAMTEPGHDKVVELEATVSEKRAQKSRRASRKAAKETTKAAAKAAAKSARKSADKTKSDDAAYLRHLRETASDLQAEAAKRASKAAKKAQKRAAKASEQASKRLADVKSDYVDVAAEKAKQVKLTAQEAGSKARERIAG